MKKQNVVIIVTDDQGYGDIAINGNPWLKTPNLDNLARTGISFENFHTDPLCAPARAGLLSGKYSFGVGVYSTLNGRYYMDTKVKTIANYFQDAGYATGMFGKWHLGDTVGYLPEDRGFDTAVSFGGGVICETPDYWNNDYFDDTYLFNGKEHKVKGYCTDIWFNLGLDFIDKKTENGQPFFCYIPTNAPHGPLNVEPKYYQKYIDKGVDENKAKFYGMIENIDDNIGKFIKHLKEIGQYENTTIIFFGDNGTATGCTVDENGHLTSGYNANMRGKKGTTYEGAHKNACFLNAPNEILGKARKIDGITSQHDILPICLEICGIDIPQDIDGISCVDSLKKGETYVNKGRTLVVHNMQKDMPQKYKDYTVLRDNMRLVRPFTKQNALEQIKSFGSTTTLNPEIYNLDKDFSELNDIYEEYTDLANELTLYYEDWYDERVDNAIKFKPIFIPDNSKVKITSHVWHECTKMCFSQNNIREGIDSNGYISIDVLHDGEYELELMRYPKEANLPLNGSALFEAKTPCKEEKPQGKVYNIISASVFVGGTKKVCELLEYSAKTKIHLNKGEQILRTRFMLENGESIGAYYVYIDKV